MPISPVFSVSQDDCFVVVKIRVPYVRISAAEMICDEHDFSFYCHPYLLKLTFPCLLDGDDDEKCRAIYDADEDHGTIRAHLPKRTRGEIFPDLDLTTLLLQRRAERDFGSSLDAPRTLPPSIEVVSSSSSSSTPCASVDESAVSESGRDDQGCFSSMDDQVLGGIGPPRYGFNRSYERLFQSFREELVDMVELPEPDSVREGDRRTLRRAREGSLFDPERYLADYFGADDDPIYCEALRFEPFWAVQWKAWKAAEEEEEKEEDEEKGGEQSRDGAFVGFDAQDDAVLKSLPNKQYLLGGRGSQAEHQILLGLMDVLFAFCFEFRLTSGEFSVESPHNITRLSSLLSWLDAYRKDSARTVVRNACRRGIIYPYVRSWKLCRKVLADVAKVLYLGKRCILKCLLSLHALYTHTDSHYMLNKMYLDDYCVWVQSADEASLDDAADDFNLAKREMEQMEHQGKEDMGFMLPELEAWALSQEDAGQATIPAKLRWPTASAAAAAPDSSAPPPLLEERFRMLAVASTPELSPPFPPPPPSLPLISVLSSCDD